jgi:hypothetical protein
MFDLGPHLRLAAVRSLAGFAQGAVPIGAFVGEVLGSERQFPEPLSLFTASIGAASREAGFAPEEEIRNFVTVMDVGPKDLFSVFLYGVSCDHLGYTPPVSDHPLEEEVSNWR